MPAQATNRHGGRLFGLLFCFCMLMQHGSATVQVCSNAALPCLVVSDAGIVCTVCPQDLAAGYMSGKLLLKLDAIGFLLTHHTSGEQGSCGCAGHCVPYPYVCHAYCCSLPDQPRPTHTRLVSVHKALMLFCCCPWLSLACRLLPFPGRPRPTCAMLVPCTSRHH